MFSTSRGGRAPALRFSVVDEEAASGDPVVLIGDCTETLIAADLALGDAHRMETNLPMSDSWRNPVGSGCTDTAVPGRWYLINESLRHPVRTGLATSEATRASAPLPPMMRFPDARTWCCISGPGAVSIGGPDAVGGGSLDQGAGLAWRASRRSVRRKYLIQRSRRLITCPM